MANLPDDFDGRVRLFPLPDLVFFPHVMQPLHIFEPRYCDMLAEALATDKLIAMATLAEGWEADYEGRPRLEIPVCVAKVVSHSETENQRHNILVLGLRRGRIRAELPTEQTFRRATVEILEDVYSPEAAAGRQQVQERLVSEFQRVVPISSANKEGFSQLLAGQLPLGPLTDVIGFTLPLGREAKIQLLNEANADQRALTLLEELERATDGNADAEGPGVFPPPFSDN